MATTQNDMLLAVAQRNAALKFSEDSREMQLQNQLLTKWLLLRCFPEEFSRSSLQFLFWIFFGFPSEDGLFCLQYKVLLGRERVPLVSDIFTSFTAISVK